MKTISNDECFVKPFKPFPILNEDTYAKVQLRWKWRHQRRTDIKSSLCFVPSKKGGIDIQIFKTSSLVQAYQTLSISIPSDSYENIFKPKLTMVKRIWD